MRRNFFPAYLVLAACLAVPSVASAIILYGSGDPQRNTTPPTGSLTNSGWQFQGQWGGFLGTPISPRHFLAAKHVGGSVGDAFVFRGVTYTTTAVYDDAQSDLRLWRVCGTFPEFAPLYTASNEIGRPFVIFGRGTQRGDPVVVEDLFGPVTKGWLWGGYDGVQRWGTNVVTAILPGEVIEPLLGPVGDLLEATFDAGGGADEAHLSSGDSSGGMFILDGTVWKLAGINFAVDAFFNTNSTGPGFYAAITDKGGLYSGQPGSWSQNPDLPANVPTALYMTRVAAHLTWIQGVINGSAPIVPPRLESAGAVTGPYQQENGATLDTGTKTFTLPKPAQNRFFRLNGCEASHIAEISVSGTNLVIRYD
jgi:hypothetical protein